MIDISVLIYFIIIVIFQVIAFKKFFITPAQIFVIMQATMMIGILEYVDKNSHVDRILIYIYIFALISFIIGVIFSELISPSNINKVKIKDITYTNWEKKIMYIIIIFSIIMCGYFFHRIGGNIFLKMLNGLVKGEQSNFTEDRLKSYGISGSGYIYQFRIILFPILTMLLVSAKNRREKLLGYCLLPLMIIFSLGTGQRGGFVTIMLVWGIGLIFMNKYYKLGMMRNILLLGISGVLLFSISTVFNGRHNVSGGIFQAIIDRVINDNQKCAVVGWRYVYELPIQYGKEWGYMLKDILPGKNTYLPLANQVFSIMYGSTRGTAPVDIWTSTYHNWGYIGVMIFPMILGFLYQKLFNRFIKRPLTRIRLFLYSAIFIYLGMWVCEGPIVLFNSGVFTIVILSIIFNGIKKFTIKVNVNERNKL